VFVTIARVRKTQGRRGEVAADLHTDFPELFAERTHLFLLDAAGERRELHLEEHWPHKGGMVLKFRGVDSISDAERLVGCEVQIPQGERAALQPGETYISDLVGCTLAVVEGAQQETRSVGLIEDVQFGAGEAPLLIVRDGAKEYMVPLAQEFIQQLDLDNKCLRMALPEGMLELDAPLTAEEKAEQQKKGAS